MKNPRYTFGREFIP